MQCIDVELVDHSCATSDSTTWNSYQKCAVCTSETNPMRLSRSTRSGRTPSEGKGIMNRNKRFMAGAAALVVAAVGFAGLQGLASAYTAVTGSGLAIPCHLYFGSGLPGTPAGDASLQQSDSFLEINELGTYSDSGYTTPATAFNAGQTVYVRLVANDGFKLGPVGIPAGASNNTTAIVNATIGGVTTPLSLTLGGANYPLASKAAGTLTGTLTLKASFAAAGNGSSVLALKSLASLTDDGAGGTADNYCDGTSAGTTLPPSTLSASGATTWTSSNFVSGVTGFKGTRVVVGTVTWEVPSTWDPKNAPAASSTITQSLTITGPNATILTSTGQNAGVQAFRAPKGFWATPSTTITLSGSVWDVSKASADFTVKFCTTDGTTCNYNSGVLTPSSQTNTLSTDGSGLLTGSYTINNPAYALALTTGNRAIKITQGSNVALVPVQVLGSATLVNSPVSGGPGTVVAVSGSDYNPGQAASVYGTYQASPPFGATGDATASIGNASGTGIISGNFTVNAATTVGLVAYQGTLGAPSASNPAINAAFEVNQDRCIADASDVNSGTCTTKQNVNVSVLQGSLVQRAYVNSTATTGSIDGSAGTTPVTGTTNVNSNATAINLGTVTSPLAPTDIVGNLNDITVSDNRGGTYGWSLTASMPNLTSSGSNTISNAAAKVTSACAAATNGTAWDYSAVSKTAISGFDATLNASGVSAGATAAPLSGTINLCVKDTNPNATTQTTGGVYNVTGTITLKVPAFQKAAKYTSTVTITLA